MNKYISTYGGHKHNRKVTVLARNKKEAIKKTNELHGAGFITKRVSKTN
jgi:hypothetical protein